MQFIRVCAPQSTDGKPTIPVLKRTTPLVCVSYKQPDGKAALATVEKAMFRLSA
jgi:hypothetical protein